jgi:hypothetical protein
MNTIKFIYGLIHPLGVMARFTLWGGGSGGGGQPTQSTVTNTNIPEYAQPYVESMLGAAQQQIFNYGPDGGAPQYEDVPIYSTQTSGGGHRGDVFNSPVQVQTGTERRLVSGSGQMNPTSIKPYTPYSQDPNAYFAGFSPMQQQSFQSAANMGVAPETGMGSALAGAAGLGALNTQYNPMMAYGQNFGQGAAQYYMNPYQQNVTDIAKREAGRQSDILGTQQAGQATQAGAFGGSRFGVQQAERERNLGQQMNDIQAQGSNAAFTNAQNQFNTDQARQMAAQQANIGQQQFGANLGLQGLQTGVQAAGQLGQLGQNVYGQQMGINQLQNQYGAQQQQLEQGKINQQIQNFATAQQYPMMQLANMSNLLRGLPMQSSTTQTYQAAPSAVSQLGGLGTAGIAGLGLYNTMNKA